MNHDRRNLIQLFALFFIWRGALLMLGYMAQATVPGSNQVVAHLEDHITPWLSVWVKWDSVWYYELIKYGYTRPGLTAFFPLYPMTVRAVSKMLLFVNPILVGLSLSTIFSLGSILVFYKLLRLDYDNKFTLRAVFYLLIFPCAIFYTVLYSESLFLFLSVSTFYFARRKRWWLCGVFGFLTALSRVVGVFLMIPLFVEYLNHLKKKDKHPPGEIYSAAALLLIPLGLLIYMLYLYKAFGDPFAFLHVQKDWGRFSGNPLYSLWTSLNLIKLGFFLSFMAAAFIIYRWIRGSYGVYVFLNILPPLISGSFMSINRHFAVVFPIYILLAYLGKNKLLDRAIATVSLLFLAYSTILYVNGYWVG